MISEKNFAFFHQIMLDAFKIRSTYYEHPIDPQAVNQLDLGLRKMVWGEYPAPSENDGINQVLDSSQVYIIRSSLRIYNIIIFLYQEGSSDMINIGPFCDEEIPASFIHKLSNDNPLSTVNFDTLNNFYHRLPIASIRDVSITAVHILASWITDLNENKIKMIDYEGKTHTFSPNHTLLEQYNDATAEAYHHHLNHFLTTLCTGDFDATRLALEDFLNYLGFSASSTVVFLRKVLLELNISCKIRLMETSIHPLYIIRLSDNFTAIIYKENSPERLSSLVYQICHKYCLLIKNYAFSNYSYLIRNTINYINQHLDEPLSLSILADHFDKNASFLSASFKKEVGKNLTQYIHSKRIQASLKLINTSEMTLTDIAAEVGIPDFAYFSKLFKKEIGISPKEYKKMTRQ